MSQWMSLLHINMLEMKTALFALQIYVKEFFNRTVRLNVDNTSTLSWINKQIAPSENIFKIAKTLSGIFVFIEIFGSKPLILNPSITR